MNTGKLQGEIDKVTNKINELKSKKSADQKLKDQENFLGHYLDGLLFAEECLLNKSR